MRARVVGHNDCARRVAERVEGDDDLELLSQPQLSICCFRFHPPHIRDTATLERLNARILEGVRARGRVIPSSTRVNNKLAVRPCFISPRNRIEHADWLVDDVLEVGRELLAVE
jgi:glutamate/tyrosine decarboxylase-like PLP-dependent enzyme